MSLLRTKDVAKTMGSYGFEREDWDNGGIIPATGLTAKLSHWAPYYQNPAFDNGRMRLIWTRWPEIPANVECRSIFLHYQSLRRSSDIWDRIMGNHGIMGWNNIITAAQVQQFLCEYMNRDDIELVAVMTYVEPTTAASPRQFVLYRFVED